MIPDNQIRTIVRDMMQLLGDKTFISISQSDMTDLLRKHTRSEGARLGHVARDRLELELLDREIVCFPPLDQLSKKGATRLIRKGRRLHGLLEMLLNPEPDSDTELVFVLGRMKRGLLEPKKGLVAKQLRASMDRQTDAATISQFVRLMNEEQLPIDTGCGYITLAEMVGWHVGRAKKAFEDAWAACIVPRNVG